MLQQGSSSVSACVSVRVSVLMTNHILMLLVFPHKYGTAREGSLTVSSVVVCGRVFLLFCCLIVCISVWFVVLRIIYLYLDAEIGVFTMIILLPRLFLSLSCFVLTYPHKRLTQSVGIL